MSTLWFPPGRVVKALMVGAHPDDIEIGCGATLLRLVSMGAEVHSLVLTGTPDREAEALAAAQSFGIARPPTLARLRDTRLPATWDAVKEALHVFAQVHSEPTVIFAPRPDDAHQDHALVGSLVRTVWRGPLILHYEIPKWDGDLGRPNVYAPIGAEVARRKVELLNEAFPSQHSRSWWDDEFFLSLMRLRGAETQARYAEAFTAYKITLETLWPD